MSRGDFPRERQHVHVPGLARDPFPLKRPAVHLEGAAKQVIEVGRNRLIVTAAIFTLCFVVLAARLLDLAVFRDPELAARGHGAGAAIAARADIVDRNGVMLATNLETASLYADATKILDPREAALSLAAILPELSRADLETRLSSGKSFIWIKRNLTPRQQWQINALGIPGLAFQREERRVYPQGSLAAHVLGFVDIDNRGISGVEAYFDERLRDAARRDTPLALSLDVRVQHAVADEVAKAVREFRAVGGAGLVLDVRTGEVLAMASLPDFDPNDPRDVSQDAKFNRVCLGVYEMGSTFKTFNTALALDSGTATFASSYDATRPIKIARFTISDSHPENRVLTVPEIFMYSSNIGSVRMALDVGTERQQDFMARLGMLRRASIELPELGMPLVPNPWREINTMTIAFGHGMSVTPLHLATGISAMVNGGTLRPATLIKAEGGRAQAGQRVISEHTSEQIRRLMRLVVMRGTGKKAEADGYLVGGKTGTAEKVGAHGGYAKKALLSSFVGAFPMNNPRYVVLVMIDEPQGNKETYGFATGGWVAAPSVSRIVTRIGPMLGMPPVDEQSPQILKAMYIPGVSGGGAE